ncbi:unnamed protein product [Zymoseptoria tritici ST99CH_1A5]|uniref:Transcription factor CBF/NF-Y/archaeal histone domain-containing protein n=2 Tax=Zymoseptoria tritici TaxID=1047171 RepID=A0A2H1G4T9_ZYMTR|nr:unnamed protein product [Zymoseptoria tritici ST99CH_1E4]SMR49752.1 unnamed protein product [Zymoseptoria tritici ST99CH_3D1]SMY22450.1 unnamed protein product [Zymoseptoria tritici ST99CH_1A5]
MDSYRPTSPDLGSLSGARPISPDLSAPNFSHDLHDPQAYIPSTAAAGHGFGYQPTSVPQYYDQQQHQPTYIPPTSMPGFKSEQQDDDDFMPDAPQQPPSKRARRVKQEQQPSNGNSTHFTSHPTDIKPEDMSDPTLGCQIRTTFPVARIKRIMQADEDIGKVAQVTPTVVSRALELFMIKLISAAAHEARGNSLGAGGGGAGKGQKRVLAQHLKRAVFADEKLDFLQEIVGKVPDAPSKAKKEDKGSDSEEAVKPKRKSKKRKESGDGDEF